jgi:hypothetical protein
MRAARRAGELSKKIEKASADRKSEKIKSGQSGVDPKHKVLEKAGISTQQASDWERLASVPQDEFETALAEKSVRDLIDKPTPVSNDALSLIGTLRHFKWRGYLEIEPEEFLETMTETMLAEVYELVPLAIAWLSKIREP